MVEFKEVSARLSTQENERNRAINARLLKEQYNIRVSPDDPRGKSTREQRILNDVRDSILSNPQAFTTQAAVDAAYLQAQQRIEREAVIEQQQAEARNLQRSLAGTKEFAEKDDTGRFVAPGAPRTRTAAAKESEVFTKAVRKQTQLKPTTSRRLTTEQLSKASRDFSNLFSREIPQREIEAEEFRQAQLRGAPVPPAPITPINIQRFVSGIARKQNLAEREKELRALQKREKELAESVLTPEMNPQIEQFNQDVTAFKRKFRRVGKVQQQRAREEERQFKQLEQIEEALKGETTLKQEVGLKKVQRETRANLAAFTGQPLEKPGKAEQFATNIGTSINILEKRFRESRTGKTFKKGFDATIGKTLEFEQTRSFINEQKLLMKQRELLAKRQTVKDGTIKAKAIDFKIQRLEEKITLERSRANILTGAAETVRDKPVQLVGLAGIGAGVAAAGTVGAGVAALGGAKATAAAAGVGKGLATGAGIAFGTTLLAEEAQIRDEAEKQRKIGREAARVGAFVTGAAGFKATQAIATDLTGTTKIKQVGVKSETTRIASEKQALDVTKTEARFQLKKVVGKPKEVKAVGVSAEITVPKTEDLSLAVSKQAIQVGKVTAKGRTASIIKPGDDITKSARFGKFQTSKGQTIRTIALGKSKVVQKDPETTLQVIETLTSGKKLSPKPKAVGIGTSKEILKIQRPEGIAVSKIKTGALFTQDKKAISQFRQRFKAAKPIKPTKPTKTTDSLSGTKLETEQQLATITQQKGVEVAQVARRIIGQQLKSKPLATPRLKTAVGGIAITKQAQRQDVKPISTQRVIKDQLKKFDTVQVAEVTTIKVPEQQRKSAIGKRIEEAPDLTQRQIKTQESITKIILTPQTPISLEPGITEPPPSPITPVTGFPIIIGGALPGRRRKPQKKKRAKKGVTPDLRSIVFGITGKPTKVAVKTGIGIRPIQIRRGKQNGIVF